MFYSLSTASPTRSGAKSAVSEKWCKSNRDVHNEIPVENGFLYFFLAFSSLERQGIYIEKCSYYAYFISGLRKEEG